MWLSLRKELFCWILVIAKKEKTRLGEGEERMKCCDSMVQEQGREVRVERDGH